MTQAQEHRGPAATPADFAERNAAPGQAQDEGATGLFGATTESLKDKAREIAEEQKTAGAKRIRAVGKAVHDAADELSKEIPGAAGYIRSAAEQIEGASARLRASSVDDIVTRLERFARAQPAATFAGSVMAGFVLSRFMKSSGH